MADIAVVGLAVMGQNLILNLDEKGFTVCAYNRTISKIKEFLAGPAQGTKVCGARSVPELVASLKHPRRIMLMVKAGAAVDDFISQLLPHLEAGDIIIDGGNSLYTDTERRMAQLLERGILFVGCGVSGGEEGARHGPSLMPGGAPAAWPHIKAMLQSIAAQVDGQPCCEWVGEGGAGHFVKMVHNGIEYGDMQLICEAYHLMRDGLALSHPEMARVFAEWEGAELSSFLIEITAKILAFPGDDGSPTAPLLTKIRDAAGQKGTGKWTVEAALEMASPMTMVSEAVFARALSARKEERVRASAILPAPAIGPFAGNQAEMVDNLRQVHTQAITPPPRLLMLLESSDPRRCMPPSSFLTPRALCSSAPSHKSLAGSSTMAPSPPCGRGAASSAVPF